VNRNISFSNENREKLMELSLSGKKESYDIISAFVLPLRGSDHFSREVFRFHIYLLSVVVII
jgi:hypothetical protein